MNKEVKKQKLPKAKKIYLIVRGEKSEFHKAPYSPIILCSRRHTALWESMGTDNGCTVYENMMPSLYGSWNLVKYKGYDIDYGTVVHYIDLFDGKNSRELSDKGVIEGLLPEAIWWSYDEMPEWIRLLGVKFPQDDWTKKMISEDYGRCLLSHSAEQKLEESLERYDEPMWLRVEGCTYR